MTCRTVMYAGAGDFPAIQQWLSERANPASSVEDTVRDILRQVRDKGDAALVDFTQRFDCKGFSQEKIRVAPEEIEAAVAQVDQADIDILREAADNIRVFHEAQKQRSWWQTREDGVILGQLVRPLDRVGLYVPGGTGGNTPLISSLLMNAIPAQVAGVPDIAVATPPRGDGSANPLILAVAHMLGITEIFRMGSAWAMAALAYGTKRIAPVDLIAGPGNIFVTTAKRLLIGTIGIDMIAGPSEVLILADGKDGTDPAWLAADMLSQAEHDALASAFLVTPDTDLAGAVLDALEEQVQSLPRNEIAQKSLKDWSAVAITPDMESAIDLANRLAPEHLELCLADPWPVLGKIRHAGAIFLGSSSPEPVGDYFAGPNHVLPTLGNARFSSALSVDTFCKKSSLIATNPGYVAAHGHKIARLARMESLEAHARSVEWRLKD